MITYGRKGFLSCLAAALMGVALLQGCKMVAPGVTYNITTLEAMISAGPEEVTAAAKDAVHELKLVLITAESTGLDGKVVASTAQGQKVNIDVKHQAKNISHVKIKVGRLGDEMTSMMILEKIKSRL